MFLSRRASVLASSRRLRRGPLGRSPASPSHTPSPRFLAERHFGIKDDGRITADEWMLYPIAFIGIPILDLPWWTMVVFFCIVRAVDIVKPWPCRGLQSIPGGRGIVVDDFFANLYSLALNWVVYILFFAKLCTAN